MSTSLSLSSSSRVTGFPLSRDEEPASFSPDELRHLSGHLTGAPRRFGRIVLMVVIVLAAQAGIVWQLHRSAVARRAQVASEMRDFEMRAQALRAEMSTLEDRIGQTREQLGAFRAPLPSASQPRVEPRPGPRPGSRPGSRPSRPPSKPPTTRPEPPRPAPIVLAPGCTSTPLGC